MRVLAVDVGIRVCGYVLCKINGLDIELVKQGQLKPDSRQSLAKKINYIFEALEREILEDKPQAIIVEKLYSHYRHPTTLGVLAQVRGVIALLSCQRRVDFFEYSPTRARKSFLGRGSALSSQVKKMAENMTGKKFDSEHTADAFSLVVAFSHDQKLKRIEAALKR